MTKASIIERNKEILGGTPVFAHTRVPVQTMLDYLADGQRLEEFLADYPTVSQDQAVAVLEYLKQYILTQPYEHIA